MDVEEFVRWLCRCDRRDIQAVVAALDATLETVEGELGWLRATREVEAVLRREGRCRQAGEAAHRATVAALDACTSAGLCETNRTGATRLARAAGDAAVGLVAGGHTASTVMLLRPFFGSMVLSSP